jgi:type IV pilus assembly protein PilV
MSMIRIRAGARRQRGTSLVEVLVALTLVAVTMLGLLGLQFRAMAQQKDSFDRRNAAIIASDFAERVTANYAGFEARAYDGLAFESASTPLPAAPAGCAPTCTPVQVAALDLWSLQRDVATRLPGGAAWVTTPANETWVEIRVGWIDPQRIDENALAPVAADPACPPGFADTRVRCYIARAHP